MNLIPCERNRIMNVLRMSLLTIAITTITLWAIPVSVSAAEPRVELKAERTLSTAASEHKFTFVMFWRENNAGTKEFAGKVRSAIEARAEKATWTTVNIADPSERAIVQRFNVSRAPMPMALVVAPNGAITGVFSQKFDEKKVEAAFVTPCMMQCMKSLQEGKLVLVSLQSGQPRALPGGAQQFQADEMFRKRTVAVALNVEDPAEERFLRDMQLDAAGLKTTSVALLAPPGVLVGRFPSNVTKEELAAKLHAAGKCCDDPNCKHDQQKPRGR